MPYFIYLALGAFVFTLLGTRLLILAFRNNPLFLDRPNARSNHAQPTPKGGGLAVVFALAIFLLAADANYGLIAGLILLAAVSLLDDLIDLSVFVRLIVQALAVLLVMESEPFALFGSTLPLWLEKVFIFLGWMWFINLFNFMDGIDGLSTTEVVAVCSGICLIAAFDGTFGSPLSLFALIAAATAGAFFWWNRHPAKIFLGDVGSIPLGFLLGYLLLKLAAEGYLYATLILPAYYLLDSGVTLLKRLHAKKAVWRAHSEHYYQRAVRAGKTHGSTVHLIAGLNLVLVALAVFSVLYPEIAPFILLTAYASVSVLLYSFAQLEKKREGMAA